MFFGDGVGGAWLSLLATHPPLADRIRRIDPNFDGDFSKVSLAPPNHARVDRAGSKPLPRAGQARMKFDPVEAITRIGTVDPQRLAYAAGLLESLPTPVQRLTRDPYSARALIYALLLDGDDRIRQAQLRSLATSADPKVFEETGKAVSSVDQLDPAARLPLVELAIPSLRQMSPDQFRAFQKNVRMLMEADQSISLFEFALLRLLMRHLAPQFGGRGEPRVRHTSPGAISGPTASLLTAIARVGQPDRGEEARRAFDLGARALGWEGVRIDPVSGTGLEAISQALDALAEASPTLKRDVLRACATAVGADGHVSVEEGELLRAIADSLGSPMPPILGESA
jgi:hypothetical protein